MKKGTKKEWIEAGNAVKTAYDAVLDAISHCEKIAPKTCNGMKDLNKAYDSLISAKSNLESRMFNDLHPSKDEADELLNVFYGKKN